MSLLASTSKGLSVTTSPDDVLPEVVTGVCAAFALSACIAATSSGSRMPLWFLSYLASVAASCARMSAGQSRAKIKNADISKLAAGFIDLALRGAFMGSKQDPNSCPFSGSGANWGYEGLLT